MKRSNTNIKIVPFLLLFTGLLVLNTLLSGCKNTKKTHSAIVEKYRPLIHFSPKEKWMNDPNGMVFYNGEYHLFYQCYPDSTVWGPMHWGHAVSKDLVKWESLPIALYPDKLGYIFSGSAVVDHLNTSGFGTEDNPPMIAIFTYHNMSGEKAGKTDYQTQGIAYSNDNGRTWTKYKNNPVLVNPGSKDFRDPKVFWHQASEKWMMVLAVKDHVSIYSSSDLKEWTLESDFGKELGTHGEVWECPDLFPMKVENTDETKWVLLISINPGGPNGGSAIQYFVGDFNGKEFITNQTDTKWIDYGTDNYAGVTWSNTGEEKYFIGWMNNWMYAQNIPTENFRGSMTVSCKLSLEKNNNEFLLKGFPVKNYQNYTVNKRIISDKKIATGSITLAENLFNGASRIKSKIHTTEGKSGIAFINSKNENVRITWDTDAGKISINRKASGITDFHNEFAKVISAPLSTESDNIELDIIIDKASVELFINRGELRMTVQVFPSEPFSTIELFSEEEARFTSIEISELSLTLIPKSKK